MGLSLGVYAKHPASEVIKEAGCLGVTVRG